MTRASGFALQIDCATSNIIRNANIPVLLTSIKITYQQITFQMTVYPDYEEDMKLLYKTRYKGHKDRAVTNFKVLGANNAVALLECRPETGTL